MANKAIPQGGDAAFKIVWVDTGDGISFVPGIALIGATGAPVLGPDTFKSASATALGNTAVWTPTTGKKFRLQRYMIEVTSNASLAAGAVLVIDLQDNTTTIGQAHSVFVPTTAVVTAAPPLLQTGWIDLGAGVLSAAINQVLNVNLSVALATGACRVIVAGIEV